MAGWSRSRVRYKILTCDSPCPAVQGLQAWYLRQEYEIQEMVVSWIIWLIEEMDARRMRGSFGVQQAMEVLAVGIALKEGWR